MQEKINNVLANAKSQVFEKYRELLIIWTVELVIVSMDCLRIKERIRQTQTYLPYS